MALGVAPGHHAMFDFSSLILDLCAWGLCGINVLFPLSPVWLWGADYLCSSSINWLELLTSAYLPPLEAVGIPSYSVRSRRGRVALHQSFLLGANDTLYTVLVPHRYKCGWWQFKRFN